MAENETTDENETAKVEDAGKDAARLDGGTYDVIRNRLAQHGEDLRGRINKLNVARKEVFGSIEAKLLGTERVTTANNCIARDMAAVGTDFIFGYNVQVGLRKEIKVEDVLAVYRYLDGSFQKQDHALIGDERFVSDFNDLYRYYKKTVFVKFATIGPNFFMVFRIGASLTDIKVFKWAIEDDALVYVDARSEHEYKFPAQHNFEWQRTKRDMHRAGQHPHVSIEDRLFVETVGGDLTVKVEDNTEDGLGIYNEPVDDPDQTLDDAEIFYANLGNLILLRIKPYQEKKIRHFVFNEKLQEVQRIDAIEDACVLLPEDHGIIFSNGYYLQTGEHKTFDHHLQNMLYEKRIASPNGEDYLFVFYNRTSGDYVLLSYNLIEQQVATPTLCSGYSFFPDGEMIYFRAENEAQKYHAIQIWQTPYVESEMLPTANADSYLNKIGNKDIVRAMADCNRILALADKEDTYANLYVDIVKESNAILDTYFWLEQEQAGNLREPLVRIREVASSAIEEFEKVVRAKKNAREQITAATQKTETVFSEINGLNFSQINHFTQSLANLRMVRGEIIGLKDLRYADLALIESCEARVETRAAKLAEECVQFLLGETALQPYVDRVAEQKAKIERLTKVMDAKVVEEDVTACAGELDLLIDIVSNLKIEDTTQRTAIIDEISAIYSTLNQVRAGIKNKIQELASVEGVAEFGAQIKLLNQAVVNYLDVCDTPEKCEEYLTKTMIQLEELEGRFADFDEFVEQLAGKRDEIYNAFESRKLTLVETRNKRASSLMRAAERMLKGIKTRVANLKEINEINGYFAADLLIEKVRDTVEQLLALGDSVKADDVQAQLKTLREDAVRQLKDRQELFVDGKDVIKFGSHHFSVNTQALDLTTVQRDGEMYFHLTGTDFFEVVDDAEFLATKDVWAQEVVSENREVYRAEYLAYTIFTALATGETEVTLTAAAQWSAEQRREFVQGFMGPRYSEGYLKGVHDVDAGLLLQALLTINQTVGLLRYSPQARAAAQTLWHLLDDAEQRSLLTGKAAGFGQVGELFLAQTKQVAYIAALGTALAETNKTARLFAEEILDEAAEYLFMELKSGAEFAFCVSPAAASIYEAFNNYLNAKDFSAKMASSVGAVKNDPASAFALTRDWVSAYLQEHGAAAQVVYEDEVAALLFADNFDSARVIAADVTTTLNGLVGSHGVIEKGVYELNFNTFMRKFADYEKNIVPRFNYFVAHKKEIVATMREELRLTEFTPRILTSFVRNRLIDKVYLPVVGDNLAKQIGVAGEAKRTDLMGLLLLISPPGYGKTTLMEYIANRLGVIFMKINGPAIGHGVTSLDPAEAPNASAREELQKLNLALEMGDNVMLYLDDIQHCNPEFLQKFISLCDAQRKIEGVYKGNAKTYDLRGKKVCVIMAGNPYTESGDKFQIPDMLANRADTYNLGDIIGDNDQWFKMSYLENALTSNPVLNRLASRSQKDVYAIIKIAETGSREGVEFESAFSVEEVNEMVNVMTKLLRVRDVILTVNQQYIASAAQAEEYRTEPAFKLQGSYRNMNRLAEKVLPIMNDAELEALLADHYQNEAQTLTSGAEANLLKLRELIGTATPADTARWEEIKRAFQKNQLFHGADQSDPIQQVVAQLSAFHDGLGDIKRVLESGLSLQATSAPEAEEDPAPTVVETTLTEETLARLDAMFAVLSKTVAAATAKPKGKAQKSADQVSRFPTELSLSDAAVEKISALLQSLPALQVGYAPAKAGDVGQAVPEVAPVLAPPRASGTQPTQKIEVVSRVPRGIMKVLQQQFSVMEGWIQPMFAENQAQSAEIKTLRLKIEEAIKWYGLLIDQIQKGNATMDKRKLKKRPPEGE